MTGLLIALILFGLTLFSYVFWEMSKKDWLGYLTIILGWIDLICFAAVLGGFIGKLL